jgi:hypothetical protein
MYINCSFLKFQLKNGNEREARKIEELFEIKKQYV